HCRQEHGSVQEARQTGDSVSAKPEVRRARHAVRGRAKLNPLVRRRARGRGGMNLFSMDLLLPAVVSGLLLGCFYAAVSIGLSVSFGLLDVPHVAHPAFLVLASYGVYFLNDNYAIDPLVAGLLITPPFFLLGLVAYRLYYETFEKRGSDASVRGIAFFFGITFI